MNFANRTAALVLIAGVGWLGGCTKAGPVDRQSNYWQRVATHLQRSTQPREQALAAQLLGMSSLKKSDGGTGTGLRPVSPATMASAKALIAKASKSEDPVALSLALQAASQTGDDATRIATALRWQVVEPDNLAPRLHTDASIEELLANVRDATRYENHAYGQIRLMTSVFGRWPMTKAETGHGYSKDFLSDGDRAAVNAFSIWAAFGIPPFQKIVNACKGEALASTPTRREDCLHVAKVMVGSSNDAISKSIGIVLLERAATSAEDTALAETLRRDNEWQRHQYYKVLTRSMGEQQQVQDMQRLLKMPGVDNEIQLMQTALREKGVALTPPADWQPPKTN